jgi:hypothetical protein
MKHDIIKTDNYLLIVSDEDIKPLDWCVNIKTSSVFQFYTKRGLVNDDKKIIYHLPLNNSPILEGVDLLPPLEDEVKKLADALGFYDSTEDNKGNRTTKAFIAGYNKAKEKYKYTEEDMRKVCIMYAQWVTGGTPSLRIAQNPDERFEQIIQSLQQPKYPIGFECEIEKKEGKLMVIPPCKHCIKPKTTTNSQGQTVLVGKYIYE